MSRLFLLVPLFLMMSCRTTDVVLRPEGSWANITQTNGDVRVYELLSLQDSLLLCASDSLVAIPLHRITSVQLNIDKSNGWALAVLFSQGIPSLVMLGVEFPIGVACIGITVLTWTLFDLSSPRMKFEQPWYEADIEELRRHMRYPQGLKDEQIKQLREWYSGEER